MAWSPIESLSRITQVRMPFCIIRTYEERADSQRKCFQNDHHYLHTPPPEEKYYRIFIKAKKSYNLKL